MIAPVRQAKAIESLLRQGLQLASQGHVAEALRIANRVTREDLPASLLSNLGSLFSLCQRHEEACQCFDRAVALDTGNHTYFYNLATAQRAIGDLRGAAASCERAIRLNQRDYQALYLRSDLGMQTPQSNHVSELESLLAAGITSRTGKTLVCYALAKELEDIGQFARAFDRLSMGAAAYRSGLRYDVAEDVSVIDTIIATHSADALRSVRGGYTEAEPIFVIGMPRSGTTLAERIIQSHTDVISVGERKDFALEMVRLTDLAAAREKTSRGERIRLSLSLDMAELGRRYLERVTPAESGSRRILDKMPVNYLYCGLIHAALPRAKIISVRRDPMDSCYAAFKSFLTGPYGFSYDLDELGRYYLAYRRLVRHWHATLPAHAYLEVHYEAIVMNFEAEARRMLEFLGLTWQQDVMTFFRSEIPSSTASAVQVRQPVYATSVGKWRRYREQLAPLARRLQQEIPELDAPD